MADTPTDDLRARLLARADDEDHAITFSTREMLREAAAALSAPAKVGGEAVDYTDIANRVQESTGRSIFPSTVKAVLNAAGYTSPAADAALPAASEAVQWQFRMTGRNLDLAWQPCSREEYERRQLDHHGPRDDMEFRALYTTPAPVAASEEACQHDWYPYRQAINKAHPSLSLGDKGIEAYENLGRTCADCGAVEPPATLMALADELDSAPASSHLGSLHAAGVQAGCQYAAYRLRALIAPAGQCEATTPPPAAKQCKCDVFDSCELCFVDTPPAAVGAQGDGVAEHVRRQVGRLAQWLMRMSHNESYFGEPAGLVKSVTEELVHAVDPIYPPIEPEPDPLAGVTIHTATVPLSTAPAAGKGVDANCWSADYGDTWLDCPDDADFVHGLKVGDEYELQASVYSWTERFRVTKVPDDANDDYEIERVSPPALTRQPVAGDGMVLVPREPSDGLLMSMAIRFDHGLGVPGYYDTLPIQFGVSHEQRLRSTLTTMRQLHEEVVGAGFYSADREASYTAFTAASDAGEGKNG